MNYMRNQMNIRTGENRLAAFAVRPIAGFIVSPALAGRLRCVTPI